MSGPDPGDPNVMRAPQSARGDARPDTPGAAARFPADLTETTPAGELPESAEGHGAAVPKDAFGGYEVIRELSHGGQAILFVAIQKATKRKVAIKVPRDAEVATSLRPDDAVARYNLGTILVRQDHYRRAIQELTSAIRKGADFSSAHFNLGVALELDGQVREALAAYREAVGRQANDPKKWYALGRAASHSGDPAAAQDAFERVLVLDPNRADAAYDLGRLHLYAKRYSGAARWLEASVNLTAGAKNADAWLWLGYSRRELGEETAARDAYDESLKLEPDNPITLDNCAWLLLFARDPGVQDWPRALQLASKAY